MDELTEQALGGGGQTSDIVRIGETVRRPLHARSAYVHALLRHFESVGFEGAPRLLGIDDKGREVLTYLAGETLAHSPFDLSDARVRSAARLVRRFHDATAGTSLAGGGEIVCHGDLGPHNIVFAGEVAVGIIDWDADVAPGPRLVDFADAVWSCADVCVAEVAVAEQARKVRLMCDVYGWRDPGAVIGEIAARFRRARAVHAAAGRAKPAAVFEEMIAWMRHNGPALKAGP